MSYCNQTKWRWFQFCMLAQATGNQLHCQNLKHWELKSPIGLLWNQTLSFAIYKRTSKALFLSRCKVSFIFWAPQTFPSPLFPCILQTVYAYAMLLCSPDEDWDHLYLDFAVTFQLFLLVFYHAVFKILIESFLWYKMYLVIILLKTLLRISISKLVFSFSNFLFYTET